MAFDFPASPTVGQSFTPVAGGPTYTWNGVGWTNAGSFGLNAAAAQFNLVNGKLVETHAGNAATFAVKTITGSDPSPTNPVVVIMPDWTTVNLTAALSLTIPSGTTVGTRNAQPFRLWFALANSGSTPKLVVRRCSDFTNMNVASGIATVSGFPVVGILSTSAISGGNTVATNYSDVAISNNAFRIIAFADYDSGLTTAGTWNAGPSRILPVGAKTPMPGEVIQTAMAAKGTASTTSGSYVNSGLSVSITPTCINNFCDVRADFDSFTAGNATQPMFKLSRNTAATGISGGQVGAYTNASSYTSSAGSAAAMDAPFTVSATTYLLAISSTVAGNSISQPFNYGTIRASEIMA